MIKKKPKKTKYQLQLSQKQNSKKQTREFKILFSKYP